MVLFITEVWYIFITELWYIYSRGMVFDRTIVLVYFGHSYGIFITELYYDNERLIFQYHKQNHKKNQTLTSFATLDIIFL